MYLCVFNSNGTFPCHRHIHKKISLIDALRQRRWCECRWGLKRKDSRRGKSILSRLSIYHGTGRQEKFVTRRNLKLSGGSGYYSACPSSRCTVMCWFRQCDFFGRTPRKWEVLHVLPAAREAVRKDYVAVGEKRIRQRW